MKRYFDILLWRKTFLYYCSGTLALLDPYGMTLFHENALLVFCLLIFSGQAGFEIQAC